MPTDRTSEALAQIAELENPEPDVTPTQIRFALEHLMFRDAGVAEPRGVSDAGLDDETLLRISFFLNEGPLRTMVVQYLARD